MDQTFLEQELAQLEAQSMRRRLRTVESSQGRKIIVDGKELLNFCSNNYLGLADDPRLVDAACEVMKCYGFGSGASRLIGGTHAEHKKLEEEIAKLKKTEAALVYSSGYMANTGIIPALMDRHDVVFSDRLNHASIVDGILLSRAEMKRYSHNDMDALEKELQASGHFKKRLIVTDSVFSMDGDRANLKVIVALARKYNAWVMVDEAHGFGVLGAHGAGLAEEEGLAQEIDIQMGTLSKAAGAFGAYVAGSKALCEYLINHSRSFIYTTALPVGVIAASSRAISIIESDSSCRRQLHENAEYLRRGIKALGFDTLNSTTPIIPVVLKDAARAVTASKKLLEAGIFVQAIRPPTVPAGTARLRITVMATHTKEDMDVLLKALKDV